MQPPRSGSGRRRGSPGADPGGLLCAALLGLAGFAVRRPRLCLGVCLLATLAAATSLPSLEIRTDGSALHLSDDPVFQASRADDATFSGGDQIIVLFEERQRGLPIVSHAGLSSIRDLHERFRQLPGVRGDAVRSLATVPDIRVGEDFLSATPFLSDIPRNGPELEEWVRRLSAQPGTEAFFLSPTGRAAAFYLPIAAGSTPADVLRTVADSLTADPPAHFDWTLTGPVVAESRLGEAVLTDLRGLIPAMALVLCLALAFFLRTLGGLLVVVVEIVLVLVTTFAALAVTGQPLTLVTTPLPVILLSMAIADEVHILEGFQPLLAAALAAGREGRAAVAECLSATLAQLARPLAATTFTTAAGLLSFTLSKLPALRAFGAASALGVILALLVSFTVVPALITVLPPRAFLRAKTRRKPRQSPERQIGALEAAVLRHPGRAALVATAVVAVALPGLASLRVGDNWLDNFHRDAGPVVADRKFNGHFWGAYRIDVVLEGRPELFYEPAGARLTEEVRALASRVPGVAGVQSHLDAVEVVMRAHGETGAPSSLGPARLADFSVLAAMSEDSDGAGGLVTPDGSRCRIRLFLQGEDYERDRSLLEHLHAELAPLAESYEAYYHFSGDIPKGLQMVREIVRHQLVSIGWTFLVIGLIALAIYPGGTDGLRVMVPIGATALLVFGVMGYAGMRLGVATSMFGSLLIGIGVDFGLHLAAARRGIRDGAEAARAAFARVGRAIRWNTAALAAGFSVLTVSALQPNRNLGILLALGITAAYLLTVLSLPALLRGRRAGSHRDGRWLGRRLGRRYSKVSVLLAGALLTVSIASPAAAGQSASALMAEVEEGFRSTPRAVRLEILTNRPPAAATPVDPPREQVVLWGVVGTEDTETGILFVFAGPRRLAGTGLLLRSSSGDTASDEMWYRMRTFDRFRRIPRSSLKLRVPGTVLTYEDAWGFLAVSRYSFVPTDGAIAPRGRTRFVAHPNLPGLAEDLGFSSAEIEVDPSRRLLERVEIRGAAGQVLRTYEVDVAARVGDVWLPKRATAEDVASGAVSDISYSYWALDQVPRELFATGPDRTPLLDRLRLALRPAGIEVRTSSSMGEMDVSTPHHRPRR